MDTKIFSVSEITRQIKLLLEDSFPALWVEGEISNFRPHHSGHLYFTLKDADAQISCVMWRSRASTLSVEIKDGLKVRVLGTIRLYEKSGKYQLDLFRIDAAGIGNLQLQFERLKQELFAEGLFDASRKKKLPQFPNRIGIITSLTGAAVQDMLTVANRRAPSVPILLYGVKVQGAGAAEEISEAITIFNKHHLADVIIIGRGGGSLEDLWAFNEEILARVIAASDIPVVSAVGHEIDYTIADFVSDLRAPTPTAAAEMILQNEKDIRNWLEESRKRMRYGVEDHLARLRSDMVNIRQSYAFRRPMDVFQNYTSKIEERTERLYRTGQAIIDSSRVKIDHVARQLGSLNPANVLTRGYSMVFKDEKVVSSVNDLALEDKIFVKLKDGKITSIVLSKENE